MVSVIENWTEIGGRVLSFKQSQAFSSFLEVKVTVEEARDVEGFPNLLKNTAGRTIDVLMPKDLAAKLPIESGLRISFRARSGRREIFVHPDFASVARENSVKPDQCR